MPTFHVEKKTKASPEAIWVQWSDVTLWSRHDVGTSWVKLDGPFVAGAKGSLKPATGPVSQIELTEVTPRSTFTAVTRLPLATLSFGHLVEGDDQGSIFRHEVRFEGLLGPVFSLLIGRGIKRGLPEVVDTVARMAEEWQAEQFAT